MTEPTIQRATPDTAPALARIHASALPNDFLPSLGLDFLERVYYPAALRSAHAATFVAMVDSYAVGFVTVASNPRELSHDMLRRRGMQLATYALRAALRDYRYLTKCLAVCRAAALTGKNPSEGEISFIAVQAPFRGRGLGRELVAAALKFLSDCGVRSCRTKTLAHNHTVIQMYENIGWHVRDRFRLIGRDYVTIVGPVNQ